MFRFSILLFVFLQMTISTSAFANCHLDVGYETTDNLESYVSDKKVAKILRSKGYKIRFSVMYQSQSKAYNDFDSLPNMYLKSKVWNHSLNYESNPSSNLNNRGAIVTITDRNGKVLATTESRKKAEGPLANITFINHLKKALKQLPECDSLNP